MEAPSFIKWIAVVLQTLPSPTAAWADIIGSLAWPAVVVFLVFRFRRYLRVFLDTIADRLPNDHIKLGWFEMRPHDPVMVLDPANARDSTAAYEPADVQRIEAMFEFMRTEDGFEMVEAWRERKFGDKVELEDFVTNPDYARERELAFREIEGLSL